MHSLSLKASVVPNAQHDPQLAWSRMVPIDLQLGHCWRASKLSGALNPGCVLMGSFRRKAGSTMVPIIFLACSSDIPVNLLFSPAFQLRLLLLISFAIELRSMGIDFVRS